MSNESEIEAQEEPECEDGNFILFHSDDANVFDFNLYGIDLRFKQKPSARNLGHGAVVWEASAIFAKYMEENCRKYSPTKLAGKTVFELGSGCGLGGLSFTMRGATVILSDLDCVVDTLTRDNAEAVYARTVSSNARPTYPVVMPIVTPLDWRTEYECPPEAPEPPYDIILLTDCVFSVDLAPDLVRTIQTLAGPKSEIYCCHEIRDEHINNIFMEKLSEVCSIKRISRAKLNPLYRNDMVELISCKLLRRS